MNVVKRFILFSGSELPLTKTTRDPLDMLSMNDDEELYDSDGDEHNKRDSSDAEKQVMLQ